MAVVTGAALQAPAQLIDQITGLNLSGLEFLSQQFEPALSTLDLNAIDDFTTNQAYQISSIDALVHITGAPSFSAITGWRVEFYSSVAAGASSLVGDQYSFTVAPGSVSVPGGTSGVVTIPLNFTLTAGFHYVGVIPIVNAPAAPYIQGVTPGGTPGGHNYWNINPGGGWGRGTSFQLSNANLGYRLNGTAVPEPGTCIAIAAGFIGLLRTRWRRCR